MKLFRFCIVIKIALVILVGCGLVDVTKDYEGNGKEENLLNETLKDSVEAIFHSIEMERYTFAKEYYDEIFELLYDDEVEAYSRELAEKIIEHIEEKFVNINNNELNKLTELIIGIKNIGIEDDKLTAKVQEYEEVVTRTSAKMFEDIDSENANNINFNITAVQLLKRIKAGSHDYILFDKERIVKDYSDDLSLYYSELTGEISLFISYYKNGETIDSVLLEIDVLEKADPEYTNWEFQIYSVVSRVALSLNPYMDDDELNELTINITDFAKSNIDYKSISNKVIHRGVIYIFEAKDGIIVFTAKAE